MEGQRVAPGKALGGNAFSKLWSENLTETSQEQGLGGKECARKRKSHEVYSKKGWEEYELLLGPIQDFLDS